MNWLDLFNAAFNHDTALWLLFAVSFLSSTLLPGGSEAILLATIGLHAHSPLSILTVATLGNTLGGLTNFAIGYWLPHKTPHNKHSKKAEHFMKRYGHFALLFSWLPIIGDPLCLAAGWLRMNIWRCIGYIAIGKCARYSALYWLVTTLN